MKKLKDIWDDLPDLEHTHKYIDEKTGLRMYQICGKKFQETVRIDYIIPILKKHVNGYGIRAKLAKENNFCDWKAVSHAVRAAEQVKEILTDNTITFPLKNAATILDIKNGKLDYNTEAAPLLESLMDEVEILSEKSNLPKKVDRKYWDDFLVRTVEEYVL